jgi:hypothetical protein
MAHALGRTIFHLYVIARRKNNDAMKINPGVNPRAIAWLVCCLVFWSSLSGRATPNNSNTDWFKEAQYGVFMHFLPGSAADLEKTGKFDVQALAGQVETMGAKYFVLTLGQNSGYFNAPNAAYDRHTGYAAGERCSTRDLPLDLYAALHARGIRLMLYLPCQTPNQDVRAQKAFGLAQGAQDQPIDAAFADKWSEVIQEWADRYGDKVSGWWFDGGYEGVKFNEAIAARYAAAVKRGNSNAIVTFNPGVRVIHYTEAEDYTAGELNEPLEVMPAGRWLGGSQWHALTYIGTTWGKRDTRFTGEQWARWVRAVTDKGGVVTLDMGPNYDPAAGPIGSFAKEQVAQVRAIRETVRGAVSKQVPARFKRAESFLGIHFDFHAGDDCTEIGKNTTREMVESIIDQVHPDYLQIDCKGHRGLTSYPTRAGNQAPGYVGDPLRIWREVTAERGVALYMHYSGVWDSEAIRKHPEWAVINADGSTNGNATSFFGAYDDQLLIPQMRELAGDYGVDGAWVDGECWASAPDYSPAALKAFREATGIQSIPRKPGDAHWFEFLEFNREAFRKHLRHYVTEVKKTHPRMQLCSNWAFTDHMPEEVSAPVDWISGDYSPQDSVNSARFSARYMARQGKPWDLMAWSFTIAGEKFNGSNQKTAVQLEREAAAVLSLGGGFQAYFTQRRDGSVRLEHMPVMAEVAKFCRARQAFCHGAVPVPQVALLYSTASHYREMNGLFPRDLTRIRGTLQALLEAQQSVEVLSEHNLTGRMAEYPLIVVAECDYLAPDFKKELVEYARKGGNLLVMGRSAARLFSQDLGVTLEDAAAPAYLEQSGAMVAVKGSAQKMTLAAQARSFGRIHATNDLQTPFQPAASIAQFGRGRIAAVYFDFSQGYLENRSETSRDFLSALTCELFPKPMVEVRGSSDVDVSVNRIKGHLAVNLVNTAGPHADLKAPIHESIPLVGPLQMVIRCPRKPAHVMLQPSGQALPFEYRSGEIHLTVPQLEIHDIVMVD